MRRKFVIHGSVSFSRYSDGEFQPSFEESSLESILGLELSLEEELDLMSLGDLESVGSPIQLELPVQIDSLLVNEDIQVPLQIEISQQQQPELLKSLVTSLKEFQFDGQINNSEAQISGENRNRVKKFPLIKGG